MQKRWVGDLVEAAPSIVFLALLRTDLYIEVSGWIGAALSAMLLGSFHHFRIAHNPVMLGINVHLLVVTPLIVGMSQLGARDLSELLLRHSYRGVLVSIFFVGCALTLFSPRGFIGVSPRLKTGQRKYSGIMLAASALAAAWALSYSGGAFLAVSAPIIVLFGLRRLLLAHGRDRPKLPSSVVGDSTPTTAEIDPGKA